MLSLEEKQDLLIKRWQKLQPKITVNIAGKKPNTKLDTIGEYSDYQRTQKDEPESNFERLARSIWEASGRDLKTIVPPGVKNSSWYLLNLKGKLEWYGNVAVGEDKQFDGWVNVVPPSGCTISYFGPGAWDRAREMAKKISSYYP